MPKKLKSRRRGGKWKWPWTESASFDNCDKLTSAYNSCKKKYWFSSRLSCRRTLNKKNRVCNRSPAKKYQFTTTPVMWEQGEFVGNRT